MGLTTACDECHLKQVDSAVYLAKKVGKRIQCDGQGNWRLFLKTIIGPSNFVVAISLTLILGIPSVADIHPVQLEKGTDSAKCAACHENKAKGKVVHSAIALGCEACHEVRVNKNVTRIKLVTTTPARLCVTCHADKNAFEIK